MANKKPLSPSQIVKLQEMFGASLRKANPFSDEAQDLIENHWDELKAELDEMCIAAINCVLIRRKRDQIIRLISGGETLVLDVTDGTETIAVAKDVFAYIDPDLKNLGADEAVGPIPKTPVAVYEQVWDATFAQMFGSAGNPETLCFTQSQIVCFVRKHCNWLHPDGLATFFLFKSKGKFFVADVSFSGCERIDVSVDEFTNDYIWHAGRGRRLVLKQ